MYLVYRFFFSPLSLLISISSAEHTDRVRVRIQRLGEVINMSAGMYNLDIDGIVRLILC